MILKDMADEYASLDMTTMAPYLPSLAKYQQAIDELLKNFMVNVVVGEEKLENYDAFIQRWKQEGGDECVKEVNNWYAEYLKSK